MNAAADRKARLLEALRAEPSPTRPEVVRRERGGLAAASCVTAVVFLLIGGARLGSRPGSLLASATIAWIFIAAVATWVALRRGRSMLGTPRGWLVYLAISVPIVLATSWFALPWPPSGPRAYASSSTASFACFAFTLVLAAPLLVAFLRIRRGTDPIQPAFTGAALGAAAGAWGAVLIDLHCEQITADHVVVGHLLPVACLALVGAIVARSVLAIRAERPEGNARLTP